MSFSQSGNGLLKLGISATTVVDYYNSLGIENSNTCNYISIESNLTNISTEKFHVYILKCNDGSYYTGYTSNIKGRIDQHQHGMGCTYTKTRTPIALVYFEELPDKIEALKKEKQIKKLTIFEKEKLIETKRAY